MADLGFETGVQPVPELVAVKAPVFSFDKLPGVPTDLGPEMKSTGEVLGIASTYEQAMAKAAIGAGADSIAKPGSIFLLNDKREQTLIG